MTGQLVTVPVMTVPVMTVPVMTGAALGAIGKHSTVAA
jgi:hypothetical protein